MWSIQSLCKLSVSWISICIYSHVGVAAAPSLSPELEPKSEDSCLFLSVAAGKVTWCPATLEIRGSPVIKRPINAETIKGGPGVCVCCVQILNVCVCVKTRWNIIAHHPAWNSLKLNVNSALSQTFFINKEHCTSIQLMKYWFGNCIVRRRKAFKALSAFAQSQLHQLLFFNGILWKHS